MTFFPHGETVYVLAYLGDVSEDSHGNPVDSWADEPGVAVPLCAFDPGTSAEASGPNRDSVTTTPRLFCPPDAVVSARDRIKVRGKVFEVVGDPGDWRHPMVDWHPGIEVKLQRVVG